MLFSNKIMFLLSKVVRTNLFIQYCLTFSRKNALKMGNYTIFYMLESLRRGLQARNFTTNVPKILGLKSSSEQIFSEN